MKRVAILCAIVIIAVAEAAAAQQAPSTPRKTEKPKKKPPRQRVVTNLRGFDLLEPAELKKQTLVVGGTRSIPRPIALAPRLGKGYSTNPVFFWSFDAKTDAFVFVLWSDAQKELLQAEVLGNRFTYPNDAPPLEPGKTYLWTVEPSSLMFRVRSDPVGFVVLSSNQREEIERRLAPLPLDDSYQSRLTRAQLFTDYRLWYDALAAYSDLIARFPDRAELYELRGTIYAQLESTRFLAERDFERAEELQGKAGRP